MMNNFDENYIIELVKKELSRYLTDQGIEIKKEVYFLGDDNEIKEQLSQKFNFSENAKTLIVSQLSLKNLYNISNAVYENEYEEKIIKFLLESKEILIIKEGIESYKIYMTYGQRIGDEEAIKVLKTAKENNAIVSVHPENHAAVEYLRKYYVENGMTSAEYHPKSRPEECEAEAVNRILTLAHVVGDAPIYIVHLTSNMGLDYIKMARQRGQKNIYVETCTQYLVLDEELYKLPGTEGLKYVMSPPLREKSNQEKLWRGIKNGDIQVVATDHCPFSYEKEKIPMGKDDFTKCPNGAPGVEARMPVLFSEGVMKGRITINKFVEVTSTNPAKICGMYPKKGSIAVGSDADLVIFDKDKKVTITKSLFHENVDYTSYEGIELQGYPIMTIVRGKVIVKDNEFIGEEGYGQFIKRYKNDD